MNTQNRFVQLQINPTAHRALRHLAIERGTTVAALLREAIRMQLPDVGRHFERETSTPAAPGRSDS